MVTHGVEEKNSTSDANMLYGYEFRACTCTCRQDHSLTKQLESSVVEKYDFQVSPQSSEECENVTL